MTFVQRFGSALNLNVHLHTVVPDGTFAIQDRASFVSLSPPTTDENETLLLRVVSRVRRCVARGRNANDDVPLDTLDELRAASAAERSTGAFVGRTGRYEAFFEGFSLHCGVRLYENDREGIERLCRYGARGPLTLGRLSHDGGDVYRYRMKRTVRGRDELVMTGKELVRKLAILVPPPRVHQVRFHGVFAPNAKHRAQVVPGRTREPAPGQEPAKAKTEPARPTRRDGTSRIDWASLLRRVFKVDVLACARCGGRMRVIAVIEQPPAIEKILSHLGMPHVPLPTLPDRGQRAFAFEAA